MAKSTRRAQVRRAAVSGSFNSGGSSGSSGPSQDAIDKARRILKDHGASKQAQAWARDVIARAQGSSGGGGAGGGGAPQTPKPVDPFMTGEDIMGLASAQGDYQANVYNLDYGLEKQREDTALEQGDTERKRTRGLSSSDWGMAGRGLATSSIHDAEIYDINATAAIRRQFLQTQLDAATLHTQNLKESARHAFEDIYMQGLHQKMTENARQAAADAGVTLPGDGAGGGAAAGGAGGGGAKAPGAGTGGKKPGASGSWSTGSTQTSGGGSPGAPGVSGSWNSGAAPAPAAGAPSPDAVAKAQDILKNPQGKSKEVIAWAREVLARAHGG